MADQPAKRRRKQATPKRHTEGQFVRPLQWTRDRLAEWKKVYPETDKESVKQRKKIEKRVVRMLKHKRAVLLHFLSDEDGAANLFMRSDNDHHLRILEATLHHSGSLCLRAYAKNLPGPPLTELSSILTRLPSTPRIDVVELAEAVATSDLQPDHMDSVFFSFAPYVAPAAQDSAIPESVVQWIADRQPRAPGFAVPIIRGYCHRARRSIISTAEFMCLLATIGRIRISRNEVKTIISRNVLLTGLTLDERYWIDKALMRLLDLQFHG